MIGQKTLKQFKFLSLNNYFDYIVDSKINGQLLQSLELYNRLSKSQKREFWVYMNYDTKLKSEMVNFIIEL